MTPREFLIGWLMEFGSAWIHVEVMYASEWYMSNDIDVDSDHTGIRQVLDGKYMDLKHGGTTRRMLRINQAGLNFIKGEDV